MALTLEFHHGFKSTSVEVKSRRFRQYMDRELGNGVQIAAGPDAIQLQLRRGYVW